MTKQKKLLIINQYASTPKYSTGAGERFYYLSPYFSKAGWDISIISGSYNHLFKTLPEVTKNFQEERIEGAKIFWVKLRPYNPERFFGRVFSWFEFLIKLFLFPINKSGVPQVVVVSSMAIFPIFYALYLRLRYKSKVILEIRDIWPLTPIQLGGISPEHPFILFLKWIEKLSYRRADLLVSVLPGFSDHASSVLGKDCKAHWIPNAYASKFSRGSDVKSPLNLPDGFKVVYCGALGTANAMEFVVESAKYLKAIPEISIVIVGEGPEKEALQKLSDTNRVHFFSKIHKDSVELVLKQCQVGIISWRDKALYKYGVSANKYNDYMNAALPILSASNIMADPVVLSGAGIQVAPESPEQIAAGIEELFLKSEEERKVMGRAGQDYLFQNNTYEVIAKNYLKLLEQCNS